MAIPKVFVSSTCYDLAEERAQLERFITNYGFQPILSEYSGVYYDVDEHTHDSCVTEVTHCDMFVLIISGRYGGKFKGGNGESITQAEYNKARELGLPIFTFVKSDVYSAQHYYRENVRTNDEKFAKKINYPAIGKQSDAVSIFGFIDLVQRASTNNGLETYNSFADIECHLKKQWAGLFFSFLQKRKDQDKVEIITRALDKLSGSTSKLESLVGNLHNKQFSEEETLSTINNSLIYKGCEEFYSRAIHESLMELIGDDDYYDSFETYLRDNPADSIAQIQVSNNMYQYLKELDFICLEENDDNTFSSAPFSSDITLNYNEKDITVMNKNFSSAVVNSDKTIRAKALTTVFERLRSTLSYAS